MAMESICSDFTSPQDCGTQIGPLHLGGQSSAWWSDDRGHTWWSRSSIPDRQPHRSERSRAPGDPTSRPDDSAGYDFIRQRRRRMTRLLRRKMWGRDNDASDPATGDTTKKITYPGPRAYDGHTGPNSSWHGSHMRAFPPHRNTRPLAPYRWLVRILPFVRSGSAACASDIAETFSGLRVAVPGFPNTRRRHRSSS